MTVANPLELPSLRHLRVVEAVARCTNLSRAAKEVHMSQPAVTQAVTKIETFVGSQLFIRNQTGTFLTDEGRIFLQCIQRLFRDIEIALDGDTLPAESKRALPTTLSRLKSSHIKVLSAVAGSTSFEDAALMLGLSRTAVQRTARDLELIIGRELYERTSHGLVANADARALATSLQRARQVFREGLDRIALQQGKGASRLFIGAQPLASISILAAAINSVLAIHPYAQVRIVEGSYGFLLQELRSGRIDLMFGALKRPKAMDDIVEEALFEDPYCVAARRNHPLSRKTTITIHELATVDWVLPGAGTQRRKAFDLLFCKEAKRPTSCIDAATVSAQMAILTSSDRVSLLTPHELASDPRLSGLVALPFQIPIARSADGVTTRLDWNPSPLQLCFLEQLRNRIREVGFPRLASSSATVERLSLQQAS
jgi:LysR family transcriptional regulator, regulator for genes of the gallate degradation pathway